MFSRIRSAGGGCMHSLNLTLLTDLYELTMMQGYHQNRNDHVVVFDMFFRKNPFKSSYSVMAGLEQVIDYIEHLHFTEEDLDYLRSLNLFDEEFLDYLRNFQFTGDIWAVEEGRLIFPGEPILKVIAPLSQAQLIETAMLNLINHQSLIATKASRVAYVAEDDILMEFGLRRAQGPDAGVYGARAAVIGGFHATSNVLAGQRFGVPVAGTHAHSWIMSFPSEYEAFRAYADLYPQACILLCDTYNTLKSGVPNAIRVFQEMRDAGVEFGNYGIRLDSGDLAYLSKKARRMLDEAGFEDAVIAASNDLDEELILTLKTQGAKINSWGVGTNLITAAGNPSFGGVYKLAAIQQDDGTFIPKIKLSDNVGKITNPGNKKVYRIVDKETGKLRGDYICLEDEVLNPDDELVLFDPTNTWKRTILDGGTYTAEEILVPIFKSGKCVYEKPDIRSIRARCKQELNLLWNESRRFLNPLLPYVDLSQKLYDLRNKLYFEHFNRKG